MCFGSRKEKLQSVLKRKKDVTPTIRMSDLQMQLREWGLDSLSWVSNDKV